MEHSKHYEIVKNFYEDGLWSITKVRNAVVMGWITQEEYFEITKEIYDI